MNEKIEAIRRFNRFYTQHLGASDAHFLGSKVSATEARVLYEIAQRAPVRAATLQEAMQIDRGYLSRMITRLARNDLVKRDSPAHDRRARPVSLTDQGRRILEQLEQRLNHALARTLDRLLPLEQSDLVQSLSRAQYLLAPASEARFTIRLAQPGEPSLIASRQSALYAESHGWGPKLECLIAETVASFLRKFKPDREACWVAELDGIMAGAVFLTDEGDGTARLRLLHVEPFARRRGVGDALVQNCLSFARTQGYHRVILWTHTVLETARRLYARNGFVCIATAPHDLFGVPLQGEDWECRLSPQNASSPAKTWASA
ncbi:bifunctional helix-turn-helix transcriptional regulator/GNAT family N-acetyltransferase [Asaia sp. HN010]|uniref:bifunctional helix-turn-helix transcriptional regulator/GNAT family N-acetyltransferase n=1 Tax=Asaia sp. HN010 TaxID=3081233 RepID=UPI003017879F